MPVATWIREVLNKAQIWTNNSYQPISQDFINSLDLLFREPFPRDSNKFLGFILADTDRTINFIALCLQNYAYLPEAYEMENILATGGSAYAVMITSKDPQIYHKGIADVVERVPDVVKAASEKVLNENELVKEAWHSCYSRNPDYAKTVSKCVDALEGLYKTKYFPAEQRPSFGKFVRDLETDPTPLNFQGDTLIDPKSNLTKLGEKFIPIRGHHTSGTGRAPTKEEAVFVLHYTIFVFQVHA